MTPRAMQRNRAYTASNPLVTVDLGIWKPKGPEENVSLDSSAHTDKYADLGILPVPLDVHGCPLVGEATVYRSLEMCSMFVFIGLLLVSDGNSTGLLNLKVPCDLKLSEDGIEFVSYVSGNRNRTTFALSQLKTWVPTMAGVLLDFGSFSKDTIAFCTKDGKLLSSTLSRIIQVVHEKNIQSPGSAESQSPIKTSPILKKPSVLIKQESSMARGTGVVGSRVSLGEISPRVEHQSMPKREMHAMHFPSSGSSQVNDQKISLPNDSQPVGDTNKIL